MVNLGKPHVMLFYFRFQALLFCHWCAQVDYNIITKVPASKCAIHCVEVEPFNFCCCGEVKNQKLCRSFNETCMNGCRENRKSCCDPKH
ncbi:hypothetical protein Hdeb2414_s0017g00500081 [Helianthus debilis subsp. tardiflorus]